MNREFPRIITMLRKEKNLSQKQAAADLGISQALLSHYEKGIRECGLDFLNKAADYYDVSCDYLLGRTTDRQQGADLPESGQTNNRFSAPLTMTYKLITGATSMIFSLLSKAGNRKLSRTVSSYLIITIYKLFRVLYTANPKNDHSFYHLSRSVYGGYADAAGQKTFADIISMTDATAEDSIHSICEMELSPDTLTLDYKESAVAMFNITQQAELILDKVKR